MNEFHKPFIKSLLIIAVVTVFAMVSSHYLVQTLYSTHYKTPVFTSSEFPNQQKTPSEISFQQ